MRRSDARSTSGSDCRSSRISRSATASASSTTATQSQSIRAARNSALSASSSGSSIGAGSSRPSRRAANRSAWRAFHAVRCAWKSWGFQSPSRMGRSRIASSSPPNRSRSALRAVSMVRARASVRLSSVMRRVWRSARVIRSGSDEESRGGGTPRRCGTRGNFGPRLPALRQHQAEPASCFAT